GIDYEIELPQARRVKPKAYADNFRYGRIENWTH
ncbi:MAG TPA: oxidoreductase, partial [Rhodopila sp.]|nr:oxidoreductase [Rhodopila sp.]